MCLRSASLLITMLAVSLASTPAAAEVPPGRVLHVAFEGTLDAVEARGNPVGEAQGEPQFVEGREGQGLLVGDLDGSAGVLYETAQHFSPERGSLCLWVKPVNWQGDDEQHHLFFQSWVGEGAYFILYKYMRTNWGLTFMVEPAESPRSRMPIFNPINDWRPGQWHHLAITWTRYEAMKLYLNGEQVASSMGPGLVDGPVSPRMRFGGAWQRNGDQTVIDEVMMFDRMLAPHEVARLAGQPAEPPPATEARDVPGVVPAQAVLGQMVLARVYDDALGRPVEAARLTVRPLHGAEPVAQQEAALGPGLNELRLSIADLPHGRYMARLELLRGGQVQAVEELVVSKETDDTWDTVRDIGRDDSVLPPFTPLQVTADNRLECYARSYEFNGGGLVEAATARGQAMLAAPVRVVATDARGEVAFTPGQVAIRNANPSTADVTGSLDSDSLAIRTEAQARYDGIIWTTLTFAPRQAVELETLRIEVPVATAQARYYAYMAYGRVDDKRFGYNALPTEEGVVFSREFLPSIWLGTEDQGIGWFAESDEHWDISGEEAVSIERRGEATVICMNIIREPRQITGEFHVEFGLQATPVRELQADWRSYQWVPSAEITRFFLHLRDNPYPRAAVEGLRPDGRLCYLYAYHQYFTSTLPKDPEEFREMVERARGFDLFTTPYTDTTFFPEWHGDYLMNPDMRTFPGARGASYGPVCTIDCCHRGPFGDWFVWYVSHLAHEYGSNGIYLDDMWPYGCSNPAHGCGYDAADGTRRMTYPLRARLETYRRLRAMFVEKGEPFWISYHMSAGRTPPLPTYADGLLLAEERNPIVGRNPDYTTNTTTEEWLASFSPEAWGIPITMLPQFKMRGEWMRDPELAHRLLAAVVPHDILIWPLFVEPETILAARRIQVDFGIGEPDTRLLPFWHADTGIRYEHPEARISAYLRPGKLLICAASWAEEEISVPVEIDLAALGLPAAVGAVNLNAGRPVPLHDGRLQLALPGKRVQFIEVK